MLAAYAYDLSLVPYKQNDGNLLQEFDTIIETGVRYKLSMDLTIKDTLYKLMDENMNVLE